MPELFSFARADTSQHLESLQRAIHAEGRIGMGVTRSWWHYVLVHINSSSDYAALQGQLLPGSWIGGSGSTAALDSDSPTLWLLVGKPNPTAESWNALDILCQHRAPLDAVLIDASQDIESERTWMIIETVCRPRWVMLVNLNIPSASAWIWHRLELLGSWRLQLRGHYVLSETPWTTIEEVSRVRSWAIFSWLPQSPISK